jgi:peptide/nickel transport system substrate-binding protein
MNSLVNADAYTSEFLVNVLFVPLLRYTPELTYAPALAKTWNVLGDTAVEFVLRDDVRWHDGARTTAHDVAFTFRTAKDQRTASPAAEGLHSWLTAEVVDSFRIRFRTEAQPDPLAAWVELPIMPAHLLDSIPPERLQQAAFNHNPVGNGPFRFVEHRANVAWVFAADTAYPRDLGGRPHLDRLIWRVMPENSAQVTELRTGSVDLIISPRAEQVKELDTLPQFRAMIRPSRRYTFVAWNARRPPLNDPRVRRALGMAVDRQTILESLRAGYGRLAAGPIAPGHWAFSDAVQPLPYDTIGARRLLDEAGLKLGANGARLAPDGQPWLLELKVPAGNQFNRDVAETVRAHLAKVGVRIRVRTLEFSTLIADITSPERRFDAVFLAFEMPIRPNLREAFHSSALRSPFQLASYRNPEMDTLLDRLAATVDRQAALPMWYRVQALLSADQPWTFFWYSPDLHLANERLQGMTPDVRGLLTGVQGWSIARNKR